eukprot:scaffold19964_cov139-Skeletonema_dohrnii-CCMP3373.AAC.1
MDKLKRSLDNIDAMMNARETRTEKLVDILASIRVFTVPTGHHWQQLKTQKILYIHGNQYM